MGLFKLTANMPGQSQCDSEGTAIVATVPCILTVLIICLSLAVKLNAALSVNFKLKTCIACSGFGT